TYVISQNGVEYATANYNCCMDNNHCSHRLWGKWRKRLLETGRMQKIKPPGRSRISTDAETTKRIVEAFDASPQKSTCQAACEHGFCPSCRLEISKGSGRLKWKVRSRRDDTGWQQKKRMRLMLATLMVLLPVGIVVGVISQLYIKERKVHSQLSPNINGNEFTFDPEGLEFEERDVMQDVQTKFVQPFSSYSLIRIRRNIALNDEEHTWQIYQGNVTSDVIIWNVKNIDSDASDAGDLKSDRNIITSSDHPSPFLEKITRSSNFNSSTNNLPQDSKLDGSLENDWHNEESTVKTQVNSPHGKSVHTEEQGENYEFRNSREKDLITKDYEGNGLLILDAGNSPIEHVNEDFENTSNDERDKESEEDEEPEIVRDDAWKLISEIGDIEATEEPEFHTFWKFIGDSDGIRKAQARIMMSYMDTTADPCVDFYQFACGNWGNKNPIPKDKAAFDTFEMLRENLDIVLKELLEEKTDTSINSDDAITKARHLYQSCMDYEILAERALEPLKDLLTELGGWPMVDPNWNSSAFDWVKLMAQLKLYNNDILISQWVGPDIKNSDEYVIQLDQTSLGLPTRDYFLQPTNMKYLEAYKNFLIKTSTLLGASLENATEQAEEIIEFETKLAKITTSMDRRRNVSELYQRLTVGVLKQYIPQVDWVQYLSIIFYRPVNLSEPIVVFALNYIQDLVSLIGQTQPRTVANYLLWRFVRHRTNNLDDRFEDAKQKFFYILFGREEAPPRWKVCVTQVNSHLGMAVGAMFVQKYFDENSKNDTLHMTEEIMQSFQELLSQTTWIDDETKELAAEKVNAMMLRIGYPDFILNPDILNEKYKTVRINLYEFFENILNVLKYVARIELDRLGTSVNKTLWNTAPAVVNAYYSRNKNQIMFPAGILQPPFYHRYFPRSINYGGIGVVIGHEITHGFDDKGRLFDKDGNLHRWWRDDAIEGFHQRAQCLIDQYSHYTVQEVEMQIDGINTQGENIADNGGIKQSFKAYQKWLDENGDANESLPGMNATGHQLFFLNFAQIWCGSMRPETTRTKLKTSVHSPGKFRVIGTLSNSEDFANVFKCEKDTPMNPSKKCSVW
ncbi:hypothetical protein L9F63_000369, partial [Diploptera punctata]